MARIASDATTTASFSGGPAVSGPGDGGTQTSTGGDSWMKMAKDAYSRSTNYIDTNYRKGWEDNLRMFQSKHPMDSKYNSDTYKYRSRIFRPKSRSVLRKNEATAALAFFSNPDVCTIDPQNEDDPNQLASAAIMQELLQYRLTKTIPWFLTSIGAFQDAMTVGLVASLQVWRYRSKTENVEVKGEIPGFGEYTATVPQTKVIEDRPCIDLLPIENIRFDPAAHWYDVVSTSPYVIIQIPMYINDVLDNMESEDKEGESWTKYDQNTLLQCRVEGLDPLRSARNDNKEDPNTVTSSVNEFDVVMVHLNFIKSGETTYAYYTLQDKHLLSKPMPVEEMFLHCKDGRPPVQIGFCIIETHKPVPSSIIGLTSELQKETNEIANQRLDNVKFVLNKRWLIRRGANVDVESLLRNVPGGVTMVNDVERDAFPVNWQDVTSSSYQEQDRVNVDMDELAGNFAQGSVMTNRKLNETVGGMKMMAQGANALTEYTIAVFVHSWMEPVLRQLVKMEQAYETDEVVLAIAAQKAKLFQQFGMNQVTDALLSQELTLTVNVGMGATDPDSRLQRLMQATEMYSKIATEGSPDFDLPAFRKQIYGLAGIKDAAKLFKKVDPQVEKAMGAAQEAQGKAEQFVQQQKEGLIQKQIGLDKREANVKMQELKQQVESGAAAASMRQAMQEMQIEMARFQQQQAFEAEKHRQAMANEQDKARQEALIKRHKAEQDAALKEMLAKQELRLKEMAAAADRMAKAAMAKRKTTVSKDGNSSTSEVVN